MKYLCLIYIEEQYAQALPKSKVEALLEETLSYRQELQSSAHLVSTADLQPAQIATTIRMRKGKLSLTDGPFAETQEVLDGLFIIEARDLNEAIQVVSKSPSLHIGSIEVRPIEKFIHS
ncbi:MAG: YciI family protein [Anaerolineales bacterium]